MKTTVIESSNNSATAAHSQQPYHFFDLVAQMALSQVRRREGQRKAKH